MPTLISHPATPLAIAVALGNRLVTGRLLFAGIFVAILPDLDVITFRFGIPYSAAFGHRGFSHSLLFALLTSIFVALFYRLFKTTFLKAFFFLFAAIASHGILDTFTNGGLGVALFWPWSIKRFFAQVRVIEVAPFALSRYFTERGFTVLKSEFLWVWAPLFCLALTVALLRKLATPPILHRN